MGRSVPLCSVAVREIRIPVEGFEVSASIHGAGETAVVLGHGAGGTRKTPALLRVAGALADSGRMALLYNFRYPEVGRRSPDPARILEKTTSAVAAHTRSELGARKLVLGGRSMGGRIATQIVAAGVPADGLALLAYPLHAPGRTDKLRDAHLPGIECPMLFVQGTRDAFARPDLRDGLMKTLGRRATLLLVEDGDHSFKVRKSSGQTAEDVERLIHEGLLSWLTSNAL